MAASLGRDTKLQEAARQYEEAVALYEKHVEAHPNEAGSIDNRLTQINSQIFWCNKLTTMAYYNAKEAEEAKKNPPVPEPKPEPKAEPAKEADEDDDPFFLMPPPARDEEEDEKDQPGKVAEKEKETEAEAEIVPNDDAQAEFLVRMALSGRSLLILASQPLPGEIPDTRTYFLRNEVLE